MFPAMRRMGEILEALRMMSPPFRQKRPVDGTRGWVCRGAVGVWGSHMNENPAGFAAGCDQRTCEVVTGGL